MKTFRNQDGSARQYLYLCESERAGGTVRQKVLANLGRIDDAQSRAKFADLSRAFARFAGIEAPRRQAIESALRTKSAKAWGAALVFDRLFEDLGLGRELKKVQRAKKLELPLADAVFAMVLNRLTDPLAKLGVHGEWMAKVYWPAFDQVSLHHLYRALDVLAEVKEPVEEALFAQVQTLIGGDLSLVLWDTTSSYFEGAGARGIGALGYSKDFRPDLPQIVIGILMTGDGVPVAHEIFPGNTVDTATFRNLVEKTERRFHLSRVILVGDRGMVSEEVLKEIRAHHLEYIVGTRMRGHNDSLRALAQGGRYQRLAANLWVKETRVAKDRYLVCLNPIQETKDQETRRLIIKKLRQALRAGGVKGLVGNRGYRRYLSVDGAAEVDAEKLRSERRFDGRWVLRTNSSLPAAEVATAYKSLWQVERVFRRLKSGLMLRPIRHWKESRVRGHVMVCFLAFVLETVLRRKIKDSLADVSFRQVVGALCDLQAVEIELNGVRYLTRTDLSRTAQKALAAVGRRPPDTVVEITG
ncbi:MAG: IS1634 family transposase [Sulfobacillus sp.]